MNRFAVIASLALSISCAKEAPAPGAATEPSAGVPAAAASPGDVQLASIEMRVLGMTWAENWPRRVRASLATVPGVQKVDVDFDKQLAVVFFAKGTPPQESAIVAALEGEGFKSWTVASEKKQAPKPPN